MVDAPSMPKTGRNAIEPRSRPLAVAIATRCDCLSRPANAYEERLKDARGDRVVDLLGSDASWLANLLSASRWRGRQEW